MNVVLWALQIVLALKFVSVAYTHGVQLDQTRMQRGIQRLGAAARPLLVLIALCVFLGGGGLILPAATGILAWLTPWSAALLALMMLLAVGFHILGRARRKSRRLERGTEDDRPEKLEFIRPVSKKGGRGDIHFAVLRGKGRQRHMRFNHGFLDVAEVEQVAGLMRRTVPGKAGSEQ